MTRLTPNRWTILAVLFLARLMMGMQFQSIAALGGAVEDRFGLGLTDIGLLVGLYLAPGVLVAIPGGAIASRFGDKRVVMASLGLMLAGGALIALAPGWNALVAGRVISGIGGVVINIVMTKMLVDWFAGREISTALAIFVNSWPVGIALALLILPGLAAIGGWTLAGVSLLAMIATALVLIAGVYRAPSDKLDAPVAVQPTDLPVRAIILAGGIWAFYNAALAMVFSFAPAVLVDAGWQATKAAALTSAYMVALSVALPLGGVVADRTGRSGAVMTISFVTYCVTIPFLMVVPSGGMVAVLLISGAAFGLAAGPIMALPSLVLRPEARAFGMGVFFTIYYAVMMAAPPIAGGLADRSGQPATTLYLGALFSALCLPALWQFRRVAAAR